MSEFERELRQARENLIRIQMNLEEFRRQMLEDEATKKMQADDDWLSPKERALWDYIRE